MTEKTPAIEVEHLTKYYGDFLAVDDISFDVQPGEIFGFLGPNGAGKSTTQRMLSTLLEPTQGTIRIYGHDLAQSALEAKRLIGLVPEESNVYRELSCQQNLSFAARLYRVPASERSSRIARMLDIFELTDKRDVKADQLSKGLRRRLSLAMALIHQPRLLFLDEPTSGLDAWSTRIIHARIQALSESRTTIFLTTHQIEHANLLCDRVAIINHGRIAAIDTPANLKAAFRRRQKIQVSVAPDTSTDRHQLASLPDVAEVKRQDGEWLLFTETPSSVIHHLVHLLEANDAHISDLHILEPRLEEVFLEITREESSSTLDDQQSSQVDHAGPGARGEK
ncbi:MAG: ATP-binding cassette domain-containing protein [Persicimonas sp.]